MKKIFFIIYGFTIIFLTFFSYAFVDANLIYYKDLYSGFGIQKREIATLLYIFLIILFFIFYFFILKFVKKKQLNLKDILILVGITCAVLPFSFPAMLSYDIFNYITTAKVLFFYHENPYIVMPIEFLGDPYVLFTHAANKLALYGPVWVMFSGIPYFLGFGNFILTLLSFKLVSVIFYLLMIWVICKLSNSLYTISLFAFNPLIIIELLVSAHNDVVMMFLLLLSFLFLQNKKYFFAISLFILSVFIKYATIFLLPVFIFVLWKIFKNKKIEWQKIYFISFLSMFTIFLLSPLREEMYPWYAIWFLPFVFLFPERKYILSLAIALSFGLMLRYVPFMYTGSHFGITPILRIVLASAPVVIMGLVLSFLLVRKSRSS